MAGCPTSPLQNHKKGLSLDLGIKPTSSSNTSQLPSISRQRLVTSSSRPPIQRSYLQGTSSTLLSLKRLPRTKEDWRPTFYHKLDKTKQIYFGSEIPYDKPSYSRLHANSSCLGNIHRSKGCLLPYSHKTYAAQISRLHTRRFSIFLQSPAIRPKRGPLHFYKSLTLPTRVTPPTRHFSSSIYRRLDNMGKFNRTNLRSIHNYQKHSSEVRVSHQCHKVSRKPYHRLKLARGSLANPRGPMGNSPFQTRGPRLKAKTFLQCNDLLSPRMGESSRRSQFRDSDIDTRSCSPSATSKTSASRVFLDKRPTSTHSISTKEGSLAMAATTSSKPNRTFSSRPRSCPPLDRCLSNRLGGTYRNPQCSRVLVPRRTQSPHQHFRSESSEIQFRTSGTVTSPSPYLHRQCRSTVCSQQTQMQVSKSPTRDCTSDPTPNRKKSQNKNISDFITPKLKSRYAKPYLSVSPGVGTPSKCFSKTDTITGATGNRSDGHLPQCKTTYVPVTSPRSSLIRVQCTRLGLEPVVSNLHISTEMAHSNSSSQTTGVQEQRSHYSSMVPRGTLVPLHPEQVHPSVAPKSNGSNEKWTGRIREVDRLQFLKEIYSSKFGDKVASRLLTAHRKSSNRQAQSVWNAFKKWLPAEVTSITSQTIMEFLIACEDIKKLNPRTILNYRSQLALPIFQAFGIDLSSSSFSLLARSQFLRNPPCKQKVPQWSLDKALETFSSDLYISPTASLSDLFLKTLFLTALASGNRASELAATIRTGLHISEEQVVLPTQPGFLFKNQNSQNPLPPDITFPALGRGHTLCPATALQHYLGKTEELAHNDFLFLHPTSGKPLTSGRLSYWLAKAIVTADPNAIKPAGHDIRKFGHSIASFRTVDPKTILFNGFWHSTNVFIQKYLVNCRPTTTNFVAGRIVS